MDKWREKIENGDIAQAARNVGCSDDTYHRSFGVDPKEWTSKMVDVNYEVKRIVDERERKRAALIQGAETC